MLKKILNKNTHMKEQGFTLIELLVVIVIIGVLAAIALPIFMNQQRAAYDVQTKASIRQLREAMDIGRMKTGKTLLQITGSGCTRCTLTTVDPLTQPKTASSWVSYNQMLDRVSVASGLDVRGVVDGYGRPLFVDENEGENGGCGKDAISSYKDPYALTTDSFTIQLSLISGACN